MRYSAAEVLREKDFAQYSDEEFAEATHDVDEGKFLISWEFREDEWVCCATCRIVRDACPQSRSVQDRETK